MQMLKYQIYKKEHHYIMLYKLQEKMLNNIMLSGKNYLKQKEEI